MKNLRKIALSLAVCMLITMLSACVLTQKDYTPTDENFFTFTEVEGGYAISKKEGETLPSDVVIPKKYNGKNVVQIADKGFYLSEIETLKIPETVKHIGSVAFSSCPNLKRVTILEGGLESIGDYTFYSCSKLSDVELPESLVSIGKSAFQSTAIGDIDLRKNVETVGASAFRGCENLASVYIGMNVSYIGENAFDGCNSSIKFFISESSPYFELVEGVPVKK